MSAKGQLKSFVVSRSVPASFEFTKPQLDLEALKFMHEVYGDPRHLTPECRDQWYANMGLLTEFVAHVAREGKR